MKIPSTKTGIGGSKTAKVLNNSLTEEDRRGNVSCLVSSGSDDLIRKVNSIATVAELLYTLYESTDREIEIIRDTESTE